MMQAYCKYVRSWTSHQSTSHLHYVNAMKDTLKKIEFANLGSVIRMCIGFYCMHKIATFSRSMSGQRMRGTCL